MHVQRNGFTPGESALTSPCSGYSLHASEGLQLVLPEQGRVLGPVTLLSPTVVWTRADSEVRGALAHERRLRVCLDSTAGWIGPLSGEVCWSEAGEDRTALGIQLLEVSTHQGRQILSLMEDVLRRGGAEPASSPLPVQEEVSGARRIASVLQSLAVVGTRGALRLPGRALRMKLERVEVDEGRLSWRCEEPCSPFEGRPAELEVVGYNSAYRMRVAVLRTEGPQLVTALPERLWRVRHRWHRRVAAPQGLRAHFEHPLWKHLGWRERQPLDLSYSGLGLSVDVEDLLFPGLFLPVDLETAEGERIGLSCEVRHVSHAWDEGRRVAGLEVRPRTPEDSARWMRFVSQTLSPATRTSETLLEPLWELYDASGYFQLAGKSSEHFAAMRRDFLDVGQRTAALPHLWCQTVWPSERGVEASLSSLKAYRYSWLLHQLGRRPGKPAHGPEVPGQILRDTYQRTLEHSQGDPEFRWMFCYGEATVPWMERTHMRFGRKHQDSGQALVMPLRLMDVECDEPSGQPASHLDIGPASIGEKYLLAEEIARTRPACYVEALDFNRERLELWGVSRAWQGAGMERERKILVARRQGLPLAALVLELGQPGTNLFRLMDSARLFPLSARGRDAYVALLDEARRWFASRGRTSFVFLCEDEGGYAKVARLHDDPTAQPALWIISASLLPEFLEHINEQSYGRPGGSALTPSNPPSST